MIYRFIIRLALILFFGLTLQPFSHAGTYSITATSLSQNIYSATASGFNGILRTTNCWVTANNESAQLVMTSKTGGGDGTVTFSGNRTCTVLGAYGLLTASAVPAGTYYRTLSSASQDFYADDSFAPYPILIRTSACSVVTNAAQSAIDLPAGAQYSNGATIGTVNFPDGATCNVVAGYVLADVTNLATGSSSPSAPGVPTIGAASVGLGTATISFDPPASNGGAAITGYTATCMPGSITATGTASPLTVTGLSNGATYSCSVAATNSAGTGTASAAVSVTLPTPSSSTVYNIPSPTNVDQPFLRFYNPSSSSGQVRGTLYDQTGAVLGAPNSVLIASAPAKSVTVLTSQDVATAFGVADWSGRAWMATQANFAGLQVLNLIRSSLLINMSCLNSNLALYLPNPTSSEQPYVRLYNPSTTAGAVRGTLYDENGNTLGTANAVLVANLAPNAVQVLSSTDIAAAVGVSTWQGKAWMFLSSDFAGLKIMNTLRDLTTNTLVDMSCDTGSTGTSANVYNLPPPNSTTTASIRIYNMSGSPSTVTGTLYAESGSILGTANAVLSDTPVVGVLTLNQSDIAARVGASTWTGRAWMQINSNVTGLKVLAFTRQSMAMDMNCVNTSNIAFNIPDATNAQDQPNIRIYNTSSAAGNVYGTLYDVNGNVVGTANSLLASNMAAKSVAVFSASTLASAVGSLGWTARSWLQLSSTFSGLQVMDILQDQANGTWSNMSCATN